MKNDCTNCKNKQVPIEEEPCATCKRTHWEPVVAEVDTKADEKSCDNCKHEKLSVFENPCRTCGEHHPNWSPKVTIDDKPSDPVVIKGGTIGIPYEKRCSACKHEVPETFGEKCDICHNYDHFEFKPKKKSKWHWYPDEKPKEGRLLDLIGYYKDTRGDVRLSQATYSNGKFLGKLGISLLFVITHFRYMPKPPKEYRK